MPSAVILISADAEWRAVRKFFPEAPATINPLGEYFSRLIQDWRCIFFRAGWGKIAAAASTQYAIDRWSPEILVNLGTCGGFEGQIERDEIVLVEKAIVYDIIEQMGDFDAHIAHYTTELDLTFLRQPYPLPVRRATIVSGDRDLLAEEAAKLVAQYNAPVGDWESGAIAWVAAHNGSRVLILRGVTDLVSSQGSAAYGNLEFYEQSAGVVMARLLSSLPDWLAAVQLEERGAGRALKRG